MSRCPLPRRRRGHLAAGAEVLAGAAAHGERERTWLSKSVGPEAVIAPSFSSKSASQSATSWPKVNVQE